MSETERRIIEKIRASDDPDALWEIVEAFIRKELPLDQQVPFDALETSCGKR